MEVVNLVFAILGHVLASVLYVVRRISFSSGPTPRPAIAPKGAIDRSSILERKDEIKDLWEKKMMSEEHQETIPVEEQKSPQKDEEQATIATTKTTEIVVDVKMNGIVAQGEIKVGDKAEPQGGTDNSLLLLQCQEGENKTDEKKLEKTSPDEDHQVAVAEAEKGPQAVLVAESCHDHHRESETPDETEEQIFTSTLQPTLASSKSAEPDAEASPESTVLKEDDESHKEFERLETKIEAEESLLVDTSEETEQKVNGTEQQQQQVDEEDQQATDEIHAEREMESNNVPETADSPDSLEAIEIPDGGEDFQHFTVLENGTSKKDTFTNGFSSTDTLASDSEPKTFDDHFVLDTREAMSPIEDDEKKETTGGKKTKGNSLGVQKTEQPYSTCTTETKIAMEIREMREREEELKLMRERQVLVSPVPPAPQTQKVVVNKAPASPKPVQQPAYLMNGNSKMNVTPGYRVSSVFGPRGGSQQPKEENKFLRNKESAVEKEIRQARDREEELRKQKGLPPRDDDPYVKPSEVKSSQAKAFGKLMTAENSRLMATAKIQHEIEEQTMREMALRESGHIQTLSSERTDAKVTKLKSLDSPECTSPTFTNGNKTGYTNGNHTNGNISPEYNNHSKRSTPSPTGNNNYYSQYSRGVLPAGSNKVISMQKFISSRGKETTFASPKNGLFQAKQENNNNSYDNSRNIPEPGKLKRSVSVESKIQQEILDMKLREEELKLIHTGHTLSPSENGDEYDKSPMEYQNGESIDAEDICPRKTNLIAQWEQRIQKSEGKA